MRGFEGAGDLAGHHKNGPRQEEGPTHQLAQRQSLSGEGGQGGQLRALGGGATPHHSNKET